MWGGAFSVSSATTSRSKVRLAAVLLAALAILGGVAFIFFGSLPSAPPDRHAGLTPFTISVGSSASGACIGQTTCSVGPVNVVAESTLVAILTARSTTASSSKNDTHKDTFTLAEHIAGTACESYVNYADTPTVAANTFMTFNFSGSTNYLITLVDLIHTYTAGSLDVHGNAQATAVTSGSVTFTTNFTNDFILAAIGLGSANAITATGGSLLAGPTAYSTGEGAVVQQAAGSVGSYTLGGTWASANYCEASVAFRPAAVPPAPTSLSVTSTTQTHIALSWTNPAGPLLNSTLFFSTGTTPCNTNAVNLNGTATSHTEVGLTAGQQYCFEVVAYNATGASAASNQVIQTTNQKPSAPTGFSVTSDPLPGTTINLGWTQGGGGIVNSTVFSQQASSCPGAAASWTGNHVTGSATTYAYTATAHENFIFEVAGWNATGMGALSACVLQIGYPAGPTGVFVNTVGNVGSGIVNITWTDPPGTLTNATIFWVAASSCTPASFPNTQNVAHANYSGANVGSLALGTSYAFEVAVWNATGQGASVGTCTGITTLNVPAAPTGLHTIVSNATSNTVVWTAPPGGATNYTLFWEKGYACPASGFNHAVNSASTAATFSSSPYQHYDVVVWAWNSSGHSVSSACFSIGNLPPAPTGVAAVPASTSSITVNWTNPHGNVGGSLSNGTVYYVLGAGCSGFNHAVNVAVLGGVLPSFKTVTGLAGGTTYSFKVELWNATAPGAGNISACATAATNSTPNAPTGLFTVTSAYPGTTVTLHWTSSGGGVGILNSTVWSGAGLCGGTVVGTNVAGNGTSKAFTVTALQNYEFEVALWNSTGVGATSTCLQYGGYPAAPSPVNDSAVSSSAVYVAWTNPTGTNSNSTVFWVVGASCSGFNNAHTVAAPTAHYTITGLTTGQTVEVEVTTTNATGTGLPSSCVGATTFTTPPAPTGVTVAASATSVSVSWTLPAGNAAAILTNGTIYYVQAASCGSFNHAANVLHSVLVSGPPQSITGLSTGVPYSFKMTLWNSTGQGALSTCVTNTTVSVPNAPTGLLATPSAYPGTTLTVSWTLAGGGVGVLNSTVFFGSGLCGGSYPSSANLAGNGSTKAITVTANVNVRIEVVAWNATGQGSASSCLQYNPYPSAPNPVNASGVSNSKIYVAWTSTPGTNSHANVYWFLGAGCSAAVASISVPSPAAHTTVTGLTTGTAYTFLVSESNATGEGALSACVAASTFGVPPPPTGLTATPSATSVAVGWTLPSGNPAANLLNGTIYYVKSSTCAAFNHASNVNHAGLLSGPPFSVGGLSAGFAYSFEMTVWNSTGQSAVSACATTWTLAPPVAPTAVVVGSITDVGAGVSWTAPPGTVINYTVFLFTGTCSGAAAQVVDAGSSTSLTLASLTNLTWYNTTVSAWNATGQGPKATCASFETLAGGGGGGGVVPSLDLIYIVIAGGAGILGLVALFYFRGRKEN